MKFIIDSIIKHPWWWFFGVMTAIVLAGYPWVAVGAAVYLLAILAILRFFAGAKGGGE